MIPRGMIAAVQFTAAMILMTALSHAAEIRVLASAALKTAYLEVLPDFERTSGHRVQTIWAPTAEMARRVGDGEAVDLVIMALEPIEALIIGGRIIAGSRVTLARSGVGMAVRPGKPKPDISTAQAFRRTLLEAKSITHSTGLSGVYFTGLIQRMEIADELKPKIKVVKGVPIAEVLARGDAELGLQQISELLAIKGVNYVGPLPAEYQHTVVYAAGVPAAATQPEAGRALANFLATPAAAAAIRKSGLEPG